MKIEVVHTYVDDQGFKNTVVMPAEIDENGIGTLKFTREFLDDFVALLKHKGASVEINQI